MTTNVFNCNGNGDFRYRSDMNINESMKLVFGAMTLFIEAFAAFMDLRGLPVFGMLTVDPGDTKMCCQVFDCNGLSRLSTTTFVPSLCM